MKKPKRSPVSSGVPVVAPRMLTIKESAAYLGSRTFFIRTLCWRHLAGGDGLAHLKFGKRIVIDKAELGSVTIWSPPVVSGFQFYGRLFRRLQAPNEAAIEFADHLDCEASVLSDRADRADDAARHVLAFRQQTNGRCRCPCSRFGVRQSGCPRRGNDGDRTGKGSELSAELRVLGGDDSDASNLGVLVVNRDERFPFSNFIARVGSV